MLISSMQSTSKVENMRITTMVANQSEQTKPLRLEALLSKLHFHMQIQMFSVFSLMENIGKTTAVFSDGIPLVEVIVPQWLSCNLAQA